MASNRRVEWGAAPRLRLVILAALALNLLLIGVRVLLYTPLLAQPGAFAYVLEPVVLLVAYGVIVLGVTAGAGDGRRVALRVGTVVGLIAGALWIVNLALETFTDLSGRAGLLATAPFLLGGFALWGAAGFLGAWRTGSIGLGMLAAIWGAMICVLLTVTFGWLLTYAALPRLEQSLITDPDFLRSHWHDLRAFAIANAFDSGFSHLLGALIIGAVVGAAGSWLGVLVHQWAGRRGDGNASGNTEGSRGSSAQATLP